MLTFGRKVCITYPRCPSNKLWRHLQCLNIQTIEVNRPSTNFSLQKNNCIFLPLSITKHVLVQRLQ